MPLLTEKQLEAIKCLAVGTVLVNPKYLYPQDVAMERFKERCRVCKDLLEHFPEWAKELVAKWKQETLDKRAREIRE
jgi:hypothetical protein